MNTKLFEALKPGGIYLVIDHKAEDNSGWRDAGTIHRMGVETIDRRWCFPLARAPRQIARCLFSGSQVKARKA